MCLVPFEATHTLRCHFVCGCAGWTEIAGSTNGVESRILQANPILEGFGNVSGTARRAQPHLCLLLLYVPQ
jgi:hypothetical protein